MEVFGDNMSNRDHFVAGNRSVPVSLSHSSSLDQVNRTLAEPHSNRLCLICGLLRRRLIHAQVITAVTAVACSALLLVSFGGKKNICGTYCGLE